MTLSLTKEIAFRAMYNTFDYTLGTILYDINPISHSVYDIINGIIKEDFLDMVLTFYH